MADVSVDSTVSTSTARGGRSVVFTTDLIGYVFYVDSDGVFGYSKTTDGGATWGAQVNVDGAGATTVVAFDVWFDQWTPGDSGTLIHTWWFDSTNDIVRWRTLDTSSDTLGTVGTVFTGASAVAGRGAFVSGTKTRSGYLFCAFDLDAGVERGFYRSIDSGANWTSVATTFVETTLDTCSLFPANTLDGNDCWALYYDASALALTLKFWDNSGPGTIESATIQTHTDGATDLTGQFGYSAAVRHSDKHLIVVALSGRDVAASTHQVFDVASDGVITTKTAIAASTDDHYYPQVFIDQTTNDIYVAYNGKRDGTEVLDTTSKVYYTKSTDGGATWTSGDTAYMEGAAGVVQQVWTPLSGVRFYAVWRVGTTLLGNKVNSVSTPSGPPPQAVTGTTIASTLIVRAGTVSPGAVTLTGATRASTAVVRVGTAANTQLVSGATVLAVFRDAFTGSGALTPDWTSTALSATATVVRVSGEATASAPDAAQITSAYVSSLAFPADQYAQVTITAVPGGESNHFCNLLVRASGSDTTFDGYLGGTNGNRIFLAKLIHNRTWTPLVDFPVHPGGVVVGDILRLEAEGTTLRLRQNGTTIASATDSTLTTGAPGIGFLETASILARSDDFEAGPLAPRVFPPTITVAGDQTIAGATLASTVQLFAPSIPAAPGAGPTRVQHVHNMELGGGDFSVTSGILDATPTSGHLLWAVLLIVTNGADRVITPPSGWTVLLEYVQPGEGYNLGIYWKIAGGSEPTSYTWTWDEGSYVQWIYLAEWSDVDAGTPIDVSAAGWTEYGLTAGPVAVPAITTLTDGAVDLVVANQQVNGPGYSLSGYTTELDDQPFGIFSKAISPAGSTGVRSVSVPSVHYTQAYSFALRPAPAAGPADQAVSGATIGGDFDVLLEDGSFLLLEDGSSHLLYEPSTMGTSQVFPGTVFAVPVSQAVTGATIASTAVVNAGTVAPGPVTLSGTTVPSTAVVFSGSVTTTTLVSGATIASGAVVFPGRVSALVGGATVSSTATLFPGAIAVNIVGAHRPSTAQLFAGSLSPSGAFIPATAQVFPGTVLLGGALAGATVPSTAQLFPGSVTTGAVTVSGATLGPSATVFPGSVTTITAVSGATIAPTAALFPGAVAPGAVTIIGATLTSTASLFPGSIITGAVTLVGATVPSTATLFPGQVTPPAATITGATIASTATPFPGQAFTGIPVTGAIILSGSTLFPGLVTPGPVEILGATLAAPDPATHVFPGHIATATVICSVDFPIDTDRLGSDNWGPGEAA